MSSLSYQIDLLERNLNTYAMLMESEPSVVKLTYYRELQKTLKLLKKYRALDAQLNRKEA